MSSKIPVIVITLAAFLGGGTAAGAAPQIEAGAPISLELQEAGAVEVFQSFASVLAADLMLDRAVRGPVTVSLQAVPVTDALDAVCARLGCRWFLAAGPPVRLLVAPEDHRLWEPLTIQLEEAGIRDVLTSFAEIQRWAVRVDPAVAGTVSVMLDDVPCIQALDAVCREAGCRWRVVEGEPPRLEVSPLGAQAEPGGGEPPESGAELGGEEAHRGAVALAGAVPAGEQLVRAPAAVGLSVVLRPPGAARAAEARARLSWSRPTLTLRAETGSAWEAFLAWIRLGKEQSVVVPFLLRCPEGPSMGESFVFDPVPLPLEESWRTTAAGATLEVRPLPADAPPPGSGEPAHTPCRTGSPLEVTVERGGKSLFRGTAVGAGRSIQILLPPTAARPESYPQVSVLLLGPTAAGEAGVGLLTLGEGGAVQMQRLALRPGIPRRESLRLADGSSLDLELAVPEER